MEERKQVRESKARPVLFQEWRKSMGMNRKEFCDDYEIPYPIVQRWEAEKKRVPDYLFRLWAYETKMRRILRDETERD